MGLILSRHAAHDVSAKRRYRIILLSSARAKRRRGGPRRQGCRLHRPVARHPVRGKLDGASARMTASLRLHRVRPVQVIRLAAGATRRTVIEEVGVNGRMRGAAKAAGSMTRPVEQPIAQASLARRTVAVATAAGAAGRGGSRCVARDGGDRPSNGRQLLRRHGLELAWLRLDGLDRTLRHRGSRWRRRRHLKVFHLVRGRLVTYPVYRVVSLRCSVRKPNHPGQQQHPAPFHNPPPRDH